MLKVFGQATTLEDNIKDCQLWYCSKYTGSISTKWRIWKSKSICKIYYFISKQISSEVSGNLDEVFKK